MADSSHVGRFAADIDTSGIEWDVVVVNDADEVEEIGKEHTIIDQDRARFPISVKTEDILKEEQRRLNTFDSNLLKGTVGGKLCDDVKIRANDWCIPGAPHFDGEGDVCGTDHKQNEAYCSYGIGTNTCAYCAPPCMENMYSSASTGSCESCPENYFSNIGSTSIYDCQKRPDETLDNNSSELGDVSSEYAEFGSEEKGFFCSDSVLVLFLLNVFVQFFF